jgi:hypothetical protein
MSIPATATPVALVVDASANRRPQLAGFHMLRIGDGLGIVRTQFAGPDRHCRPTETTSAAHYRTRTNMAGHRSGNGRIDDFPAGGYDIMLKKATFGTIRSLNVAVVDSI